MVSYREFLSVPDSLVRPVWPDSRPQMDPTSAQFTFKRFIFILVGGNPIDIDVQLYGQSNPYGQTDSSADISNLSQSLSQGLTIGGQ